MAAVAPWAILLGAVAAVALVFASFSEQIFARIGKLAPKFVVDLEAAGMKTEPKQFVFILTGIAAALWVAAIALIRPAPLVAILIALACAGATFMGGRFHLKRRKAGRVAKFQDQLEGALRSLSGGIRVGLGIRQALVLTSDQSREPVKTEFMRVVGLSNLGWSILDAFDQMALRMTNTETTVLARVIRVQAQTGGDLGSVLDGLAGTIRDRRRLRRRVKAITAQGRATAWLLGMLPLVIGMFILSQDELRDPMLHTLIGQVLLAIALGLDGLAIFCLVKITKIDP
ncbi:MAG: type II secretion system F family protein [Candidatus Eremiobacteraeota bacterium]|nr:type II secretion system F family protein [Candidatus Eremiobacteraeota bacterium]